MQLGDWSTDHGSTDHGISSVTQAGNLVFQGGPGAAAEGGKDPRLGAEGRRGGRGLPALRREKQSVLPGACTVSGQMNYSAAIVTCGEAPASFPGTLWAKCAACASDTHMREEAAPTRPGLGVPAHPPPRRPYSSWPASRQPLHTGPVRIQHGHRPTFQVGDPATGWLFPRFLHLTLNRVRHQVLDIILKDLIYQ